MIRTLLVALAIAFGVMNVPALPMVGWVQSSEEIEWDLFHADAFDEYADEFTALFNSYETKWSKNGRLMMRSGDSGSFRFVAKGK
jgi:hypothetical protein